MKTGESPLADLIMEDVLDKFELLIGITQSVAMCQVEHLAVDLRRLRLLMQNHTTLLLQIIVGPDIVVAGEVMHLHTHICQLRKLPQETSVALWYDKLVFVPEVKHVT